MITVNVCQRSILCVVVMFINRIYGANAPCFYGQQLQVKEDANLDVQSAIRTQHPRMNVQKPY